MIFTFIEKNTVYLYFCDRNALRLLGRSRSWSRGEGQSCASTARLRSRTRQLRVSTSLTWLNSVWEDNRDFQHTCTCGFHLSFPHSSSDLQASRLGGEASSQVHGSVQNTKLTKHAQQLFVSLPPEVRSDVAANFTQTIETERSIRQWRISAQKVDFIYSHKSNISTNFHGFLQSFFCSG